MPRPSLRAASTVAACILAVYGMIYVDLVLRARSAYNEGMKYLEWNKSPELKAAHFDVLLADKEKGLRGRYQDGEMTKAELGQRLELARFVRDESVKESSLKYAYVWFQTAVELFSPPESKYVVLSREKMAYAKDLWKKELDFKKIPYEDYMLE